MSSESSFLDDALMERLIYVDETLPEIEIRELATIEEVLAQNPVFVALHEEDVLHELIRMFPHDHAKALRFTQMIVHRSGSGNASTKPPQPVCPILDAESSLPAADDDTGGDPDAFLAKLAQAAKAPGYLLQQRAFQDIARPFVSQPHGQGDHALYVAQEPTEARLLRADGPVVVMRPGESAPLRDTLYRPLHTSLEQDLAERVLGGMHKAKGDDDPAASSVPSLEGVLAKLRALPDLHGLRVHLALDGYALDQLNEEQLRIVLARLGELATSARREDAESDSPKSPKSPKSRVHGSWLPTWGFLDALKQAIEGVEPSNLEALQESYQQALLAIPPMGSSAASAPVMAALQSMRGVMDALSGKSGTVTIAELRTALEEARNKERIQLVRRMLHTVQSYQPEDATSLLDSHRALHEGREAHDRDGAPSESLVPFMGLFTDIKEIQAAMDTSMYEGDPDVGNHAHVYEDIPDAIPPPNPAMQRAQEAEDEVDAIGGTADDRAELLAMEVDAAKQEMLRLVAAIPGEGAREIAELVLPTIVMLRDVVGLPLDLDSMVRDVLEVAECVQRPSRLTALTTALPEISPEVARMLFRVTGAERADIGIILRAVLPEDRASKAVGMVKTVLAGFEDACTETFYTCIAWWSLTLLAASLEDRLAFDPMAGMVSCLYRWGPFGMPLQAASVPEGIVPYIACVIKEIAPQLPSALELGITPRTETEEIAKRIAATMQGAYEDTLTTLQEAWAVYKRERGHREHHPNVRAAEISLLETIKAKNKDRIIPEFIQAFLLLPQMLGAQGAYGCCYQQLGQDYRADSDWSHLPLLRRPKDRFQSNRMGKRTRIPLWHPVSRARNASSAPDTVAPMATFLPKPEATVSDAANEAPSQTGFSTWLTGLSEQNVYLLPPTHITLLKANTRTAHDMCETFLTMVGATTSALVPSSAAACKRVAQHLVHAASLDDLDALLSGMPAFFYQRAGEHEPGTTEHTLLRESASHVQTAVKALRTARTEATEKRDLARIWAYVTARALCLPAAPEVRLSRNKLYLAMDVAASFLPRTLAQHVAAIEERIAARAVPDLVQQQETIARMREQQKAASMQIMDVHKIKNRQMMVDLKRLGFHLPSIGEMAAPLLQEPDEVDEGGMGAYEGDPWTLDGDVQGEADFALREGNRDADDTDADALD